MFYLFQFSCAYYRGFIFISGHVQRNNIGSFQYRVKVRKFNSGLFSPGCIAVWVFFFYWITNTTEKLGYKAAYTAKTNNTNYLIKDQVPGLLFPHPLF